MRAHLATILAVGVLGGFGSMVWAYNLVDVTPGAANPPGASTPALPPPYDTMGLANVLSPAVTPGVTTTSVNLFGFDWVYQNNDLNTLPTTNTLNDEHAPATGAPNDIDGIIFWTNGYQRVSFSGLSANVQNIRVWGDNGDRIACQVTVYSTTATLAGADLLDPTKYSNVALATTAVSYTGDPWPSFGGWQGISDSPWYQDFAVATAAGTTSILLDFGYGSTGTTSHTPSPTPAIYWSRLYEIQAFGTAGASWPNYLDGDFNKDGEVGPEDFGILKDNFGLDSLPFGNHESWTLGDANDDGEIGPEDFGMLKDNFGLDGGPTGTYPLSNVPEPATLALLGLTLPILLKRRPKA
ncbi:MAG: hypothetical protein NTV86_18390 [Planctomycetota bacterium]|nr:hypothetical protein [Planctomycetota bacterium]